MLRMANTADLPGIVLLWQEAFGDSEQSVRFFFRSFPNCRSYVAEENGAVVSMVHALPQRCSPDTPAAYIYAVATAKTHRGKGLCRKLMAYAEADLKTQGFACCVLTPGGPGLYAYYAQLGYRTAFTRRRMPFPGGVPISLDEYMARRESLLQERHMVYDKTIFSYAAAVYGLTFYETARGIAAASPHYTAEVLPEDLEGARMPFGMVRQLADDGPEFVGYLGFALE